jgi:hypothetical protein
MGEKRKAHIVSVGKPKGKPLARSRKRTEDKKQF